MAKRVSILAWYRY